MEDDSVIVSVDLDYGDNNDQQQSQPEASSSSMQKNTPQRNTSQRIASQRSTPLQRHDTTADKWSPQLSNRSAKWCHAEIRILCQYLIENSMKMFGNKSPRGKASKKKQLHWMKVTHAVNSVAEQPRHWQQVRKKWSDLYYSLRNPTKKKGSIDAEVITDVQKACDSIQTVRGETDDASSNASESAPQSPQQIDDAPEYDQEENPLDDSYQQSTSKSFPKRRSHSSRPQMVKEFNKSSSSNSMNLNGNKMNGNPNKRPRRLGNVLNSRLQNGRSFDDERSERLGLHKRTQNDRGLDDELPRRFGLNKRQHKPISIDDDLEEILSTTSENRSFKGRNDRVAIEREKVFIEREKLLVMQDQLAVKSEMLDVHKNILSSLKDISKCMKIYVRNSMEH